MVFTPAYACEDTRILLTQSNNFPLGPIVRIAPNYYSIDDMEAIKTIYGHGTEFIKVCSPTS